MKHKTIIAALIAFSMAAVGAAYASSHQEKNDALAISQAKISLVNAVNAAQQHVGGAATKAEFEMEKGQGVYEVEVVKGQEVLDVKVGAADGQIISVKADKPDHEDSDKQEGSNEHDD